MDEALRRAAAHVLVADVAAPVLDDGAEHHLRRVLRLRDGDAVTVTDGAGAWRPCRLTADGLDRRRRRPRRSIAPRPVTVAVAPPKGDRLEWLVQKCTEVGVARIVLLDAERSVVRWDAERAGKQLERLRRIAAEAAMQSRRVWLPDVAGPVPATRRAARTPPSPSRAAVRSAPATRASPSGRRAGGRRPSWRARPTACRSARTSCASRRPPSWRPR